MLKINQNLKNIENEAEYALQDIFKKHYEIYKYNTQKVLNAFLQNRISSECFHEVTGYGFFDAGRDKIEKLFADIFGAEDALVRPQIMSGTNAIWLTLSGLLHYGDTLLSISGTPYDPLQNIIGINGESKHSLINNGIKYEQIELINSDFDYAKIEQRIKQGGVTVVAMQRSRGYEKREGLSIEKIKKVCEIIKNLDKNIIIMCDNCYGEMVEKQEPTEVGVDVVAGSLMHNMGGGISTSGGYVVGKENLIYQIAERLTAPCVAKDLGANYNQHNKFLRGIYFAPQTVFNAVKSSIFASYVAEKLGYKTSPTYTFPRTDIIQTIELETQEKLEKFCQNIQTASPVDSFALPIPCELPGYPHDEIMAAGTFTNGSTIELTCDAPVIPPYTVYLQGGLNYEHSKLAILHSFSNI